MIPTNLCFLYSIIAQFDSNLLLKLMIKILEKDARLLRSGDKVGRPFCCCIVFSFLLRSADKVGRPFCCCIVFSLLRFPTLVGNLSVFVLFLRFPTLVGNLSVFVLFLLIIKVSDVSRKPFCFRFVFSYYSLFFILYSLFFIFLLYFPHHCPSITLSIFNRLT